MRDAMARLRAALTPRALLLLGAVLLIAGMMMNGTADGGHTELEKRTARTLSQMEGAGNVSVVIVTKSIKEGAAQGIGMAASQAAEVPVGAIAVADGADDPIVRMELEAALCALLGLPNAAVNVMAGGE